MKIVVRYGLCAALLIGLRFVVPNCLGQSEEQVRKAFTDLREDEIKYNCSRATYWLSQHREDLRDQILEELYRTSDPQERDSLLVVLFQTNSFTPDERFARLVVQRLREEDTRVPNMRYALPQSDYTGGGMDMFQDAHHIAWQFIDQHYALFEPLLKAEIAETDDMWELWGIAWMMKRHNTLKANSSLFTPEVLTKVAVNLKNDTKRWNASQAIRIFLMLPNQSLPVLRAVSNSPDVQQRSLARAFIDALRGNRNGLGYLNSKVGMYHSLLDGEADRQSPEWINEVTQPYLDKQSYP